MRKVLPIAVLLACTVSGLALADGPPEPAIKKSDSAGSGKIDKDGDSEKDMDLDMVVDTGLSLGDKRIKLLMYDESDVYTITTRYGYQTNIVFGAGEEINTISVGDRSMWQIIPSGNRLFIRPMQEDVTTNMTILTNRHSYQFDLKSLPLDKSKGNIYVAKFKYPEDQPKRPPMRLAGPPPAMVPPPQAMSGKPPSPMPPSPSAYMPPPPAMTIQAYVPPPVTGEQPAEPVMLKPMAPQADSYPNYNYTYSGPDELAPVKVYDDGKSTYIKYGDMPPAMPSVFTVDADGTENPTTFEMKNGMMILDAVVPEIALRNNKGNIRIYNEMLNPS